MKSIIPCSLAFHLMVHANDLLILCALGAHERKKLESVLMYSWGPSAHILYGE